MRPYAPGRTRPSLGSYRRFSTKLPSLMCRRLSGPLLKTTQRFWRWSPVIFIAVATAWSYYVFAICFRTISNLCQKTLYFIVYHVLFLMSTWSFLATTFASHRTIPEQFYVSATDAEDLDDDDDDPGTQRTLQRLAADLPASCRGLDGNVRYCRACHLIKPERTQHCSECNACVLKMDHHCLWLNNCVSYANRKFFILLLTYALVYVLFLSAATGEYVVRFWSARNENPWQRVQVLVSFVLCVPVAMLLFCTAACHCFLLTCRGTTLEPVSPRDRSVRPSYIVRRHDYFVEAFGERWYLWFFPVFTGREDDGTTPLGTWDEAAEDQRWLLRRGRGYLPRTAARMQAGNVRIDSRELTDVSSAR